MKNAFTVFLVLALSGTAMVNCLPKPQTRGLREDFQDFLNLVPVEKIKELFYDYVMEDEDFGEAIDYIMSEEFKAMVINIEGMYEVKELMNYLEEAGLPAYEYVNKLNDYLEIPHIRPRMRFGLIRRTGGIPGFIKDVKALIPIHEMEKLYKEKLNTSKDFAALIHKLSSPDFQHLVDKILAMPKIQEIMHNAKEKGVDLQELFDFLSSLLGLKFPKPTFRNVRNLQDDLNDFLALIPVEKIHKVFMEYVEEDEDFGEAIDYIMSEEFKSMVMEIEAMHEVKELINYLEQAGLPAYKYVNKLNDFLEIPHIHPRMRFGILRRTGGIPGFIKDVKALIPIDKMEKLYKEKLHTSKDFAALIHKLSSPDFQHLVDKILAMPKIQEIMHNAKEKGVDLQELFDFLSSLLGLKFPKPTFRNVRNLQDDLNDFLALIPVEKIHKVFMEYVEEDEDFGEAIDYIMSEEFKSMVMEIESMHEVKELINYLEQAGLPAYKYVNKLNDFLEIPLIRPRMRFGIFRRTGGIPGFIKDVKALIPIHEMEKLYKEKLNTSKDFAALIHKLSSPDFQHLVDKILAMPKIQEIMHNAKEKGVDLQELFDFLSSLLGLKFPKPTFRNVRNLQDDLNDFLALIPVEKIHKVFMEYVEEDEDFGEAIDYIMSEEFKSMVMEIEAMHEVKELINYLEQAGLPAYKYVNKLNDFLEIPHIHPRMRFGILRRTGGIPGFIKDVKALIPVDKMEKLYKEKLHTSKDFAALIHKLSSPDFQHLVDKILAMPKIQEIMHNAKEKGVDLQELFDFLSSLLGLKFPKPTLRSEQEVISILKEISEMVPMDSVLDIVLEYLTTDEEFNKFMMFIVSDEFKEILASMEQLPEVKAFLRYLNDDIGLDVYKVMDDYHAVLGMEKFQPLFARKVTGGGLAGLMQDLKNVLPYDDLDEIYQRKLETSAKFRQFVDRLQHKELLDAVKALENHAPFQVLVKKLQEFGLDINEFNEMLGKMTGIRFPPKPL
ncbi:hypothetical protein TKK_0009182 [Trichogramma kaykai]